MRDSMQQYRGYKIWTRSNGYGDVWYEVNISRSYSPRYGHKWCEFWTLKGAMKRIDREVARKQALAV